MKNRIICGDCNDELDSLEDESVDLLAADPPYGFEFMGKDWDRAVISTETWQKVYRVLKPGSLGFVMSIPRQDCLARVIVNLGDAGFLVHFTSLYWAYATGFPKAANVSKLADKRAGVNREKVRVPSEQVRNPKSIGGGHGIEGGDRPWMRKALEQGFYEMDGALPVSEMVKKLEGAYLGWQPKPAVEVIVVVRKPYPPIYRSDLWEKLGWDYYYTVDVIIGKERVLKKTDLPLYPGDKYFVRLALNPALRDMIWVRREGRIIEQYCEPYENSEVTSDLAWALLKGKAVTWLDRGRIPVSREAIKGAGKNAVQPFPGEWEVPRRGENLDRPKGFKPSGSGIYQMNKGEGTPANPTTGNTKKGRFLVKDHLGVPR